MKEKILSALMAASMLISSTIAPLAATKSYASEENVGNQTIMTEKVDDQNDNSANELEETDNKETDNKEIENKAQDVQKEENIVNNEEEKLMEDKEEKAPEKDPLPEEKEKIIEKTENVSLYDDKDYKNLSQNNIDIKISGQMPENGFIRAYEIKSPTTDISKENVFAFGFEIFDKDGDFYRKNPNDEYKIEIKTNQLTDIYKISLYEKNKSEVRFSQTNDFSKTSKKLSFYSQADEFAIAKDLKKEEEKTSKVESIVDKKSPSSEKFVKDEADSNPSTEKKESNQAKDILESFTKVSEKIDDKEEKKATQEKIKQNENKDSILESVDRLKDLFYGIGGKQKNNSLAEDTEKQIVENTESLDDKSDKEESKEAKSYDTKESTEKSESAEEIIEDKTQTSDQNEEDQTESQEDKDTKKVEKSEEKETKSKEETNSKEKLSYQQVLADIYTDGTYSRKSNDQTRIKLSGKLPGYTKIKAYPVEIEIEGKEVLAAYDITIFDEDDNEYKVTSKNDINVQITNQKIKEAREVEVYHKENEFASEERIDDKTKTDDTVAFKADSFSIYAVTDPEAKNIKFVFFYQDKDGKNIIWDVQNIRNGEKLIQPELPIFSHDGKFEGWYYYDYCNKDKTEEERFGEKFDFDKAVSVDKNSPDVKYLKGKYTDVLIINFVDKKKYKKDDGSFGYVDEILSTKQVHAGGKIPSDDIPVISKDSETVFSHWSLEVDGKTPFDFNRTITKDFIRQYKNNKSYGELNLYAVYKKALTVTFDSQGGTHVNRQIVYSGDKIVLSDLTNPVKPGYNFKYWSESPNGPAFNKDKIITSNTKLYAVYSPQVVKYKINHWRENANGDGYSILKTESRVGNAGTLTNSDSATYKLSSQEQNNEYIIFDHADQQKVINGNSSTEINLYYKRKTFTLRIYEGVATDVVKVKLKWGEQTQPYLDQALKKLGNNYTFKENNFAGKIITTGPEMPKNDYTLLAWREGSNDFNVRFIDLDTNELIRLDQKTSRVEPWLQRYDGGETIKGFTYRYVESPGSKSSNARLIHGNGQKSDQYEVWVYYSRNKWNLTFSTNGNGEDIVKENVPYDKNLSEYLPKDYIVDISKNAEGKVFAGWYDNPDGLGNPIDFRKKTMPDNNLRVYAKWDLPKYKVIAYRQRNNPAAGTTEQIIKEGGFVDKSKLSADKPTVAQNTPGSELRWYAFIDGALVEYNFSDPVTSDVYLYPVWLAPVGNELRPLSQIYRVKYRAPGMSGSDVIYLDPKEYVNNAEAIILAPNIDKNYRFPDGSVITMPDDQVFQGWVIDKDSDFTTVKEEEVLNKVYQPGDIINVVGNIMFKPLFNKYQVTKLTLKETSPSGEVLPDVIIEKRVHNIKLPDDIKDPRDPEDLRVNDTTVLPAPKATNTEGYKFIGWSTTKDGKNAKIFAPGQKVLLTNEKLPNILYGIWEEETYNLTINNIIEGNIINSSQTISYQVLDKDGKNLVEPFDLKNGESKYNIPIPYSGFKVIASSQEGSISYEAGEDKGGNIYEKEAINNDINVTFTTLINPPPPTGVKENIIPMAIMLTLASMTFAYILYKKSKLAGGIDE